MSRAGLIAAQQRPDHATLARFVVRHEIALAELFGQVLELCADAGLGTVAIVAIDGTKVHANAHRDRTMTYEQIAQAIVEDAIATDIAETAVHGEHRGDELPEPVATPEGRQRWLRAARQRLEQRRALVDKHHFRSCLKPEARRTMSSRLAAAARRRSSGSDRTLGECIARAPPTLWQRNSLRQSRPETVLRSRR